MLFQIKITPAEVLKEMQSTLEPIVQPTQLFNDLSFTLQMDFSKESDIPDRFWIDFKEVGVWDTTMNSTYEGYFLPANESGYHTINEQGFSFGNSSYHLLI